MDVPSDEQGFKRLTGSQSFAAGDVVRSCEPWVCSFKYSSYKETCAYCFKRERNKLMTCSSCQLHHYCGAVCQAADWKQDHKRECKMLKEINVNIRKLNPAVEMVYRSEFEFCTAEVLVAKIVNKIKIDKSEDLTGFSGLTTREVLEQMSYNPHYEKLFQLSNHTLHARIWPTATLGSIPEGFDQLLRKVYYNVLPLRDLMGKEELFGAGLFPRALHRQMTPVCWDVNVTMDLQRRTLVVRATEDIVNYTGLQDLRQNELLLNIFAASLPERRLLAQECYFTPCTCKKCTGEYDAEINPLKCVTTGCNERIPSDHRANQPCSQCGALNDQRLRQLKTLMERNAVVTRVVKDVMTRRKYQCGLLLELNQANIVHLDAHFRYVLGSDVLRSLVMHEKRYEEAWNLCTGLIAAVRAVYPKYHLHRACMLRVAGEVPCQWYCQVGKEGLRSKWKDILSAKVVDWLLEARTIYRKLAGPDNQWEGDLARDLQAIVQITMEITLGHV